MSKWNYLVEVVLAVVMFGVASDLEQRGFYERLASRDFTVKVLMWLTVLGPSFILMLLPDQISLIIGIALICIFVGVWIGRRRLP